MKLFQTHKTFNLIFGAIVLLNLLFLFVLSEFRMVAKPLIMLALIGFYIGVETKRSNSFVLALIFALLGDIFLMFESKQFFMLGLGSFLLMQILYAVNFYPDRSGNRRLYYKTFALLSVFGILVITYLWSGLGELRIPVLVYAFAILMMVFAATIRRRSLSGYNEVVAGVLLFLISDAFLGVSEFGFPNPAFSIAVMGTYMAGQFLIVRGMAARNQPA